MAIYNRWGDRVRVTGVNTGDEVSSDNPTAKFDLNLEFVDDEGSVGGLTMIDLNADYGMGEILREVVRVYTRQQVKRTDTVADVSYETVLKDLGLNPAPDLVDVYADTLRRHAGSRASRSS